MWALAIIFGVVAVVLGGLAFWQYQERKAAEARANQRPFGSGAAGILRGVLSIYTGGAAGAAGGIAGLLGGGNRS